MKRKLIYINGKLYVEYRPEDVVSTDARALKGKEPTMEDIEVYMQLHPGESFYTAREKLREQAYGGKPPGGYQSWGDYWKAY